jgi:hypothetical protein
MTLDICHTNPEGREDFYQVPSVTSPDKSHSSTCVVLVSQDPGANDGPIGRHQTLQFLGTEKETIIYPSQTASPRRTKDWATAKRWRGLWKCS